MKNNWLNDGWIYQVFCGRWDGLDESKNFWQNLNELDWDKLIRLGMKTVYLLGVWENVGPVIVNEEEGQKLEGKDGRVPSMMAISDHTQPSVKFGSVEELRVLISTLHDKGLKVIADFVPNHTSTAHLWLQTHPEYYLKNEGKLIYEFSGDVVKLDYGNNNLRDEMNNVIREICELGFDGVRCDMAHLIPNDFWSELIINTKMKNDGFVFIAECYGDTPFDQKNVDGLIEVGFDATYDHVFYGNLTRVIVDHQSSWEIAHHLNYINRQKGKTSIHYAGNHDDPPLNNRRNSKFTSDMIDKYRQALVCLVLLGGEIGLFANGFLGGMNRRLNHHSIDLLNKEKNELLSEINNDLAEKIKQCNLIKGEICNWEVNQELLIGKDNSHMTKVVINLTQDSYQIPSLTAVTSETKDGYEFIHSGCVQIYI